MNTHMSRWIESQYSKVRKAELSDVVYHTVLRIPRATFTSSATTFGNVSSDHLDARYYHLTLLLYMEVLRHVDLSIKEDPQLASKYPAAKVYLEWVPESSQSKRAGEYRVHAFFRNVGEPGSASNVISIGTLLENVLCDNESLRLQSIEGAASSRKPDPLAILKPHQEFKRISKENYAQNICALQTGDLTIAAQMDAVLSHVNTIQSEANPANPLRVFNIDNCFKMCKAATPEVDDKYITKSNYKTNTGYTFPNYENVWRLTPEQISPHGIMNKLLPDVQALFDERNPLITKRRSIPKSLGTEDDNLVPVTTDQTDRPMNDDMRYDEGILDAYDMRSEEEKSMERLNQFTMRGNFHLMYDAAKAHYDEKVAPFEGSEWAEKYRNFQNTYIELINSTCFTKDSNVSPMIKHITRWGQTRPRINTTYLPVDDTLSPFANRVLIMLEQFEQYDMISTAHMHYYVLQHARLDAYRRCMDNVKMNTFFFGEGASGKSFMFNLIKQDSIPGSVVELTYQTGKADAIDGNRNGEIVVMHEVPPTMFRSKAMGKHADKSEESRWKDKLTRQKVTVKTFFFDEATGRRTNRTAESECGGVWFGACNQTANDIEEALATRFLKVTTETTVRFDKDITDCQNAMRRMGVETKEERNQVRAGRREEQYIVCMLEHYIWMGVLQDVDESAYHATIMQFKKKQKSDVQPRDLERVRIFSRVQAICTALDIVYNLPNGPLHGQRFEPSHLPIIEPYLVITEEMVIFTLSLLSYMFVPPAEHKMFHALHKLYQKESKPEYLEKENGEKDYNYWKAGTRISLVPRIYKNLDVRRGRVPEEEMKAIIQNLPRKMIRAKPYVNAGQSHSTRNDSAPAQDFNIACRQRGDFFIHVDYLRKFENDREDPVADFLKNRMSHKHARTKKMIIARPYGKCYHVLQTFTRQSNNDLLKERNALHMSAPSRVILGMSSLPPCRRVKEHVYTEDFDDFAYRSRCEKLCVPVIDPQEMYAKVHDHNGSRIRYPEDLAESYGGVEEAAAPRPAFMDAPPSDVRRVKGTATKMVPSGAAKRKYNSRAEKLAAEAAPPLKKARTHSAHPVAHASITSAR